MKKIYHLGTCSTNQRILKEIKPAASVLLQDIKLDPITEEDLDAMKELAGTYEALFSKVARKYRALGLHEMQLSEADYRRYILQEYTFLKRPVIIAGKNIFIGNAASVIAKAKVALG